MPGMSAPLEGLSLDIRVREYTPKCPCSFLISLASRKANEQESKQTQASNGLSDKSRSAIALQINEVDEPFFTAGKTIGTRETPIPLSPDTLRDCAYH